MDDKAAERRSVLISYSRRDEVWKNRLVKHLEPLRREGLLETWDDRIVRAGDDWSTESQGALDQARVVVLLLSVDFLTSELASDFKILHRKAILRDLVILPVLVRDCDWRTVSWLRSFEVWAPNGKSLDSLRGSTRDARLAALARHILSLVEFESYEASRPAEPRISISRLPISSRDLFGREAELKTLDDAWENPQIRVVSIVGWGGVGKTAVVGYWLGQLARDQFRGAERVFAWTFSGSSNFEGFLEDALRWFGDPQPAEGSSEKRAERLSALIRTARTLLILDGIDLFQDTTGRILSLPMEHLIRDLSLGHRGLTVLTSRFPFPEGWPAASLALPVRGLPPDAGAALLRAMGIRGPEPEIAAASIALEGHPLSLELFGNSLRETRGGDIPQHGEVGAILDTLDSFQALHRMLAEYEALLQEGGTLGILRLFGLFDRPATLEEIEILCSPPIPGLTDIHDLQSEPSRAVAFTRLTQLGLLRHHIVEALHLRFFLVHPLVRQHFRQRLLDERPKAFRQAHERLFRYLSSTVSGRPETLEEMTPLIHAVAHACAAGLRGEAVQLYRDRIARGDMHFLVRYLGGAETELRILASFFEIPWERTGSDLSDSDALFVLGAAGHALQAAGRPREAQTPLSTLVDRTQSTAHWIEATRAARRLSEVLLSCGHLGQALVTAEKAQETAAKSGDPLIRTGAQIVMADALHQAGRLKEARDAARHVEVPSYRFFDLQLSLGRFRTVLKLASNERSQATHPVRTALSHLALGRAQMEEDSSSGGFHFDQAVEILRRGFAWNWFPATLIARANFLLRRNRLEEAGRDLLEALEHATRSELRLQEADAHIGFARLHLATNDPDRARQSLSRARSIVDETGYHRRDGELQELEAQLSSAAAASPLDPVTLAFRLVLAGHALPDFLLRPDLQKIEEAARRLTDEPGDPLLNAQRILEEQQPGIAPNPLWASWITITQGKALQQAGRKGQA